MTEKGSYELLRYEVVGLSDGADEEGAARVGVVTLSRPKRLNALSRALMREIIAVCREIRTDDSVRAVVFAGEGRWFSAGADLTDPEMADRSGSQIARWRRLRTGPDMIRAIVELSPITLCAIQGGAVGGAACIATACDVRVGADDCVLGYPEIDLGMNLSWGALPLCVRLVGPARAKRLVILGRKEPASVLAEWGILDEIVPANELMEHTLVLAREYASKPPFAAQAIKRTVNALSGALDQAIVHMDTDQYMLAVDSDEHHAAVQAFVTKRAKKA